MRVRLFVDFWNFSLQWKDRSQKHIDWKQVPVVLRQAADDALSVSGLGNLQLEETRVYASYEPGRENRLKQWLNNFLDKQPGVRVFAAERRWRERPVHCRSCDTNHERCPKCGARLGRSSEKTIDARIVTDLMALAWESAYDVALLVSSDRDFIPAVEHLQEKNLKVVNATWRGHGHELAKVCWASFEIDSITAKLERL